MVVLGLDYEEGVLEVFDDDPRRVALGEPWVVLLALLQRDVYFRIDQLPHGRPVIDHGRLIGEGVDELVDEDAAVGDGHHVLLLGMVENVVGPLESGLPAGRYARHNDLVCREQPDAFVQILEVLEGVVGPAEEQVAVFVADGPVAGALVQAPVAVRDEHLRPVEEQRVRVGLVRQDPVLVQVHDFFVSARTSQLGPGALVTVLECF